MMKTQKQIFYEEHRKIADCNQVFLTMVNDPVAPLTRAELTELIHKRPELWARFGAWLNVLD